MEIRFFDPKSQLVPNQVAFVPYCYIQYELSFVPDQSHACRSSKMDMEPWNLINKLYPDVSRTYQKFSKWNFSFVSWCWLWRARNCTITRLSWLNTRPCSRASFSSMSSTLFTVSSSFLLPHPYACFEHSPLHHHSNLLKHPDLDHYHLLDPRHRLTPDPMIQEWLL